MKWITSFKNINDATAFGTWFLVASISLIALNKQVPGAITVQVALLFGVYAVSMTVATRPESFFIPRALRLTMLGIQLVSAFAIAYVVNISFLPILTIVWVAILVHFVRFKIAMVIAAVVVILWFWMSAWRWEQTGTLYSALLFGCFHLFALLTASQAIRFKQQAEDLLHANQQLNATQEILKEVSTLSERTRIARDLHDVLGHHLTALTINLQIASRTCNNEAKETIEQSHKLAKLLLSDVRQVVSGWRDQDTFDFEKLLALMLEDVPKLTIHKSINATLHLDQMPQLKIILLAIQEAITNSLKHSQATRFWIDLTSQNDHLLLSLRDNGKVKKQIIPGNGLSGMQERVSTAGGKLKLLNQEDGLQINITLPNQDLSSESSSNLATHQKKINE